jgi:hypothetical protein
MNKYKQLVKSLSVNDCKSCCYYLKETIEEESMCMKFVKLKTYLYNPVFGIAC